MFVTNKCQCKECQNPALSVIRDNEIIPHEPGFCFEHTEDKIGHLTSLLNYINSHEKIIGLCAYGISVNGVDLSGKKFYGCNFQHSTFSNIHSTGLKFKICTLDFSTFSDCDMLNSDIQFSSFSGSKFIHVVFTGSGLVHNNYNGITAYQCSFDDSDFYNSRFIRAILMNTSMKNCNLKKAIFYNSAREHVSFKLSNTREALIDRNKSGLIEDFSESEGEDEL